MYQLTVDVRITGNGADSEMLFRFTQEDLAKQGLSMEDRLVAPPSSGRFALPINNHNLTSLSLPADQLLGSLVEDVAIVDPVADFNLRTKLPAISKQLA